MIGPAKVQCGPLTTPYFIKSTVFHGPMPGNQSLSSVGPANPWTGESFDDAHYILDSLLRLKDARSEEAQLHIMWMSHYGQGEPEDPRN